MARFDIAEQITGKNEGGYANNPSDHGGETYAGIARKFWPNWSGWEQIDAIKHTYGTNANTINLWAKKDVKLQQDITDFYKANFWDVNKLDLVNDQQVANSVYDFGVNAGTKKAAKTLQKCVNVTDDGIIGNMTLTYVNKETGKDLLTTYNSRRRDYYEQLASNPTQHQFLSSWLSRLKPYV